MFILLQNWTNNTSKINNMFVLLTRYQTISLFKKQEPHMGTNKRGEGDELYLLVSGL